MPDRGTQIDRFLTEAGWGAAQRKPLTGDWSARRYARLTDGTRSAILMDSDRDRASLPPFIAMTDWLLGAGLSAPRILARDTDAALLLLEDFGDDLLSTCPAADREARLTVAIDVLAALQEQTPPPLASPSPADLVRWTDVAGDLPGADPAHFKTFQGELETFLEAIAPAHPVVALRDYHAGNLVWLPDRDSVRRMGLLDYQDVFLGHPAYDVMSLLTDVRDPPPADVRHRLLAYSGVDPLAFDILSVQRNLRILGRITWFAGQGRPDLAALQPNVLTMLRAALSNPQLRPLADGFAAAFPGMAATA